MKTWSDTELASWLLELHNGSQAPQYLEIVKRLNEHHGTVHPPDTMFLREHVGEARDSEGTEKYLMAVSLGDKTPILTSKTTGKIFTVTWHQIMDLAVRAGIDHE